MNGSKVVLRVVREWFEVVHGVLRGKFESSDRESMTDRNRELVPGTEMEPGKKKER